MSRRKPELDQEDPPPDENDDIKKMVELIRAIHHAQRDGRVLRAQHAKDTGCVKARIVVERDLPDEYRRGVFRTQKPYDAVIRFSNGSEFAESDGKGTPRGMAIKVLSVEGERVPEDSGGTVQDFLLVDSPAFIFGAVKDYTALFALRKRLRFDLLALLAFAPFYPRQALNILKAKRNKIENSLIRQYWSMAPFLLGTRAAKFSAMPPNKKGNASSTGDLEGTLVQKLATHLKGNDATFDFMVQLQTDPVRMPIEDASVEWSESASRFRKVATIEIPRQDLGSEEMRRFRASCEDLSFNPWHSLAEHRPLGGLNRLRRVAYEASVRRRLEMPS
jgi:hypothetical protein